MKIIDFANLAVGVPFADGGRDFQGWDCWGLIVRAYRDCFRIELPDLGCCSVMSYEQGRKMFDGLAISYQEVPLNQGRAGDVVILRGDPCHAALVVQPGLMLHVDHRCATCIEPYRTGVWKTRVIGIYRHAKFTDSD